jgi:excisionase family DNA binding protein
VRECLDEYFVLEQEIASALTPAPGDGGTTGEGIRLAHGLLDDVVRRVVEEIQRRDASSDALREQLRLIAWMIDRAYCGLVGRLPDVEPSLRAARMASAERSVLLWRKAVRSSRATEDDVAHDAAGRLTQLRAVGRPSSPSLPSVVDRLALRIEEVATVTGISASLVRALIRDGELPAVKVRTIPLVLVADLLAFLERRRIDAGADADRIVAELEASLRTEEE